jgi:hypothetical protein
MIACESINPTRRVATYQKNRKGASMAVPSVISVTQEAEIKRIMVQCQSGQKTRHDGVLL